MKQAVFLLAVYALILNQARKDEKDIVSPAPAPPAYQFLNSETPGQYHVEKYRYFDQTVYLLTSAESRRRMIVFEDGTVMDVLDKKVPVKEGDALQFISSTRP